MSNYPFETFPLTKRIGIVNPVANLDARYGPWPTFNDALTGFNSAVREKGLTVAVSSVGGSIVEYWYRDGIADNNLILKQSGSTDLATVTNYLSTSNVLISSLSVSTNILSGGNQLINIINNNAIAAADKVKWKYYTLGLAGSAELPVNDKTYTYYQTSAGPYGIALPHYANTGDVIRIKNLSNTGTLYISAWVYSDLGINDPFFALGSIGPDQSKTYIFGTVTLFQTIVLGGGGGGGGGGVPDTNTWFEFPTTDAHTAASITNLFPTVVNYLSTNNITLSGLTVSTTISTTGGTSSQWNNTVTYVQSNSANFPTAVLQLPSNRLPGATYNINSTQYGTVYQTVSADQVYAIQLEPGRTITLFISGNHDSLKRHTVGFVNPAVYQFYINGAGQSNYFYTFKNHITKVTLTNPLTSITPTPRLMGAGTAEIIRTDLNQNQGGLGFITLETTTGPTDFLLQENGGRLVIRNFA